MALGKRKPVQQPLFVATADLIAKPHPFYDALNRALDAHHFDTFAEGVCAKFYDDGKQGGRPGLPPGIYFRCLMVGYFEGIDSERGIDWRCNDSISLKLFLGIACDRPAPDHHRHDGSRSAHGIDDQVGEKPGDAVDVGHHAGLELT